MRALACVLAFAMVPAAASAGPKPDFRGVRDYFVPKGVPRLEIPGQYSFERTADKSGEAASFQWHTEQMAEVPKASGISFGPLHAESEMVNGKRRMHYQIDGLTLMGGQIGASLSTRHAILTVHWDAVGD